MSQPGHKETEPRYFVLNESWSHHCCFEATVMDRRPRGYTIVEKTSIDGSESSICVYPEPEPVCECVDEDNARKICEALNGNS